MSTRYTSHFSTQSTPQTEKIPGSNQVQNNAGGFSFELSDFQKLDRFLILGTEGGTYYVSERRLTIENASTILKLIQSDGVSVVNRVVEISDQGRAPSNDPALFVLAMALKHGNLETRRLVRSVFSKVARTGTHLFHFAQFLQGFGGWGRLTKKTISSWYLDKDIDTLQYQLMKYQGRDGWTHADLIRLSHVKTGDDLVNNALRWSGAQYGNQQFSLEGLPRLQAFELAKSATKASQIVKLIKDFNLPRECVPTQFLNEKIVWEALLERMPLTAMIRNLGNMSAKDLLVPLSDASKLVVSRLSDSEYLQRSRVHPITVLSALRVYSSGRGLRGSNTWRPVPQVVDALDDAFYASFKNVRPTGKNIMLALDVSGSMTYPVMSSCPGLTPRDASAALAMVTARTESNYIIKAFSDTLVDFDISPRMRLDTVIRAMDKLNFGGTDCAAPMIAAKEENLMIDAFFVYTDSETWSGYIHPTQALKKYRNFAKNNAKLAVVGMVSNGFTIADPKDPNSLDVVGFDTNTPNLLSEFIRD